MKKIVALLIILLAAAANAKDAFPGGCVDCHVKEGRLSTLLGRWNGKPEPKALAAMQAFVPKGITLKGRHPTVPLKDVPASCMKCHSAKSIPPLAPLLHGVHLAKNGSMFLTKFGGECTHCHKLNAATATWANPSGPEK